MQPIIKRIGQHHVVSDVHIYVNADETKIVESTDSEVHHLLASPHIAFPLHKAIRLGLLRHEEPIALEKVEDEVEKASLKAPEQTKAISAPNSTKKKD